MQKKHIPTHLVKTMIVDEGDLLLNHKNMELTSAVIKKAMRDTQLVVVSAGISKFTRVAMEMLDKQPTQILETEQESIPSTIAHVSVSCEEREKPDYLRKLMAAINPQKALAIVNNRDLLEKITEKLKYHNLSADCIHGESTQQDRKRMMDAFRQGTLTLLLATDLATRGLDFVDIDVVFCVTASENPSDYLHKAGRTGRGDKDGMCISLISPKEIPLYRACEKQFGIHIKEKQLREGKLMDSK